MIVTMDSTLSPATAMPSLAERRWACCVHLGALLLALLTSWLAGLAGALGAGVVAAVRPLDSEFVAAHARAAFNFNFSLFLYALGGLVLVVLTLGLGLLVVVPGALVLAVVWLVCSVRAAVAASEGKPYRYPFSLSIW